MGLNAICSQEQRAKNGRILDVWNSINSHVMPNSKSTSHYNGYESADRSIYVVHTRFGGNGLHRIKPGNQKKIMAQMKLTIFLVHCFGWTAILGGIVANLDNIKSGILFVVGLVAAALTIWSKWLDLRKNGMRPKNVMEKSDIIIRMTPNHS